MGQLSWRFGSLQTKVSEAGKPKPGVAWDNIPPPKDKTLRTSSQAGERTEAKNEKGELVDAKQMPASEKIEFQLFVAKGEKIPFKDKRGIVGGEHALRFIPDDPTCIGWQADRVGITVLKSSDMETGILFQYEGLVYTDAKGEGIVYDVIKDAESAAGSSVTSSVG